VPDGVFTKLLRPCNLFNAQLGSRPANDKLSKVKKNVACRVHLITLWVVRYSLEKLKKIKAVLRQIRTQIIFPDEKQLLDCTDLNPNTNYKIFSQIVKHKKGV
jgi:hypothetical protein